MDESMEEDESGNFKDLMSYLQMFLATK